MTVENRTDKQLTDKAQAAEAQTWASNLHQVRVSSHRGGGGGWGGDLSQRKPCPPFDSPAQHPTQRNIFQKWEQRRPLRCSVT